VSGSPDRAKAQAAQEEYNHQSAVSLYKGVTVREKRTLGRGERGTHGERKTSRNAIWGGWLPVRIDHSASGTGGGGVMPSIQLGGGGSGWERKHCGRLECRIS